MNDWFRKFASRTAEIVGSPWAFLIALLLTVGWALSGPLFGFSDTWQLVINTASTISTGLIVFLIQNTQNRDAKAIHLKLDELIRSAKGARNTLVDLEDLSDDDLKKLQQEFARLREHHAGLVSDDIESIEGELEERAAASR
ncbi:MAG: low affinity iron permease family protein [Kouleothrix sp.]|nr:low affinity iron permease family protein [Kouleothrix sp.]